MLTVRPVVTQTAESLRGSSAEKRQCYFDDEKPLQFFRTYTQRNCELECLSAYVLRKCGCTRFSLPRDNNAAVCGAGKISCMDEAEREQLNEDWIDGVSESRTACNCLPACTSVAYDVDVSQSHMEWDGVFAAYKQDFNDEYVEDPASMINN